MKFIFRLTIFLSIQLFLNACIGDDFLMDGRDPEVRITTSIDTLGVTNSFQMEYMYLNNVGIQEFVPVNWNSSNEDIAIIDNQGLLTGVSIGAVDITAEVSVDNEVISDTISIIIGDETVTNLVELSGDIETTSTYKLEGGFTLTEQVLDNIVLSFGEDYCASGALPGLYVYLSNNENSIADALEISEVTVFEGEHDYIINNVGINDYSHVVYFCKPFNIKVGDGKIN